MSDGSSLTRLVEIMQRLLSPDGCPWDREQSFETLRPFVIEDCPLSTSLAQPPPKQTIQSGP